LTNAASSVRSGTFTIYLFADGKPLAILTAAASAVPAKGSQPISFTSNDKWGPGTKTLVLVASP
jgi:hypothetical protein